MFAKFNLKLAQNQIFEEYKNCGLVNKLIKRNEVHQALDQYLLKDGSLDASAIEGDWFPEIKADVFLSHSHADEKAVIGFAGYLYKEFGITSFIDSTVWGYADILLKQIDEKYCVKTRNETGNNTYSYEKKTVPQLMCIYFFKAH